MSIPAGLKPVKTFLMRAAELDRAKMENADIMAYTCRVYAMHKAFGDDEVKAAPGSMEYLGTLMDKLETDKAELVEKYGEDVLNDSEANKDLVKQFAMKIFKRASDQYKAGKANKKTAITFHASAAYFEVAGADDEALVQARKTAKFNATEILGAIREGRTPMPPQVEEDDDIGGLEDAPPAGNGGYMDGGGYGYSDDLPAVAPSSDLAPLTPDPVPQPQYTYTPEPVAVSAPRTYSAPSQGSDDIYSTNQGDGITGRAKQHCDLAMKAIKFSRYEDGVNEIANAIGVLENNRPRVFTPGPMSAAAIGDVNEFLAFAARTLETAGSAMSLPDAKRRAANLLSEALKVLHRA